MNAAHGRTDTENVGSQPRSRSSAWCLRLAHNAAWFRLTFVGLCLVFASASTQAQTVTATVNVGKLPFAVAVNPATNIHTLSILAITRSRRLMALQTSAPKSPWEPIPTLWRLIRSPT